MLLKKLLLNDCEGYPKTFGDMTTEKVNTPLLRNVKMQGWFLGNRF